MSEHLHGCLWLVARVDAHQLPAPRREELIAWIAAVTPLSVDEVKTRVRPVAVISQDERDRSLRLHLSRFVFADGAHVIDHAYGELHTEPLVYPITEFPAWLPAVSHQQGVS